MNWLTQNWTWILLLVGVFLLFRRGCAMGGSRHAHHGQHDRTNSAENRSPTTLETTTATDPVTGKSVETAHAITSVYQGNVYYFENQENRQRFEASPTQYARPGAGQPLSRDDAAERPHSRRHGGCC